MSLATSITCGATAAHVLDDRRGVVNEHVVVVDLLLDVIEDERRSRGRRIELQRIDLDAVRGAGAAIALGLKRRPGKDQREVDVEEHRLDRGLVALQIWRHSRAKADSMDRRRRPARAGSSRRRAAASAVSLVIAPISPGSRSS